MLLFSVSIERKKKKQSQTQEKRTERARVTPLSSCAQAPVPARAERAPRPRRRRINSESGAREGRSPRSREGAGRRGAGRGSRARCGPAQGVGVACGRAGPRQPAPAQAQSRSVGAGGAWRALRPGLWASGASARAAGFDPEATLAAPGHSLSFLFLPPVLSVWFSWWVIWGKRGTVETSAFPSHAFPFPLLNCHLNCPSALISPAAQNSPCTHVLRSFPSIHLSRLFPSIHLPRPGSPLGSPCFLPRLAGSPLSTLFPSWSGLS